MGPLQVVPKCRAWYQTNSEPGSRVLRNDFSVVLLAVPGPIPVLSGQEF